MATTTVSARDAVCQGRARNVVCHCRGGATSPPVFALAVLFAVIGLTGVAWSGAAIDATAHTPVIGIAQSR